MKSHLIALGLLLGAALTASATIKPDSVATVYMYRQITPENLVKIYQHLGRPAHGKVAVKLSTGEPGGHNFLSSTLIKDLVQSVDGTIVECNTAYGGKRSNTADHLQAAKDHGFTAIAPVQIMDAEGEVELPVPEGKRIKNDLVGAAYPDYDYTLVLSHFKGHAMGGFGGAIKNIAIGIASAAGKARIHSGGVEGLENPFKGDHDAFLEAMAEAAKAVINHAGNDIVYVNVANNLSVDCDCDSSPEDPCMSDIGILASADPVALDRACVDLVRQSTDRGRDHMLERIDSRNGMHTLDYAQQIGAGTQKYRLVVLEEPAQ